MADRAAAPARVVFVCVENSNRSQMAEAFARMHGAGVIAAASAGSRPSGRVNPRAIEMMRERGYDLSVHQSKPIASFGNSAFEWAITMGCGDDCPWLDAAHREDWPIPDARDVPDAEFRTIRDDIERRVIALISTIGAAHVS